MPIDSTIPADFNGIARLFPLPNVVFFPKAVLPLHIFEPRYRQMTADSLAGDRLIAMALLQPGWEADYEGRPAMHEMACVGKIMADQRLEDGRYTLLLHGLSRARILGEVESHRLYRSARVELLSDSLDHSPASILEFQEQLRRVLPRWLAALGLVAEPFWTLIESGLPTGNLADIMTFALPLEVEFKQQMLEELDCQRRAEKLVAHLETHTPPQKSAGPERHFPPDFSPN